MLVSVRRIRKTTELREALNTYSNHIVVVPVSQAVSGSNWRDLVEIGELIGVEKQLEARALYVCKRVKRGCEKRAQTRAFVSSGSGAPSVCLMRPRNDCKCSNTAEEVEIINGKKAEAVLTEVPSYR